MEQSHQNTDKDRDTDENNNNRSSSGSTANKLSFEQLHTVTKDVKGVPITQLPLCYYFCGALFVVPENREVEIGHWHFSTDLYLARIGIGAPFAIHNLRTPPRSGATSPERWITFHFNVKPRSDGSHTTVIQSPHLTLRGMSLRRFTKYNGGYNPSRIGLDPDVQVQQTKYRKTHKVPGDEDYFIWDRDSFLNSKVTIHIGEDPRELFEIPIDRGLEPEAAELLYQLQSGLQLAISAVAATESIQMPLIAWPKMLKQISTNSTTRSSAKIEQIELKTARGFGEIEVVWDGRLVILRHIMGLRLASFELLDTGEIVLRDQITAVGDSIYECESYVTDVTFLQRACQAGTWKRSGTKYDFSIYLHFVPAFALICQVCRAPDAVQPTALSGFFELLSSNWWYDGLSGDSSGRIAKHLDARVQQFLVAAPELLLKLRETLFILSPEAWAQIARQLMQQTNHWKFLVDATASKHGEMIQNYLEIIARACLDLLAELDPFVHGSPAYMRERFIHVQGFLIWHILHMVENSPGLLKQLACSTSSYKNQQLRTWLCIPFIQLKSHDADRIDWPAYQQCSRNTIIFTKFKFAGLGIVICPTQFLSAMDLALFMYVVADFVTPEALHSIRRALEPRVRKS